MVINKDQEFGRKNPRRRNPIFTTKGKERIIIKQFIIKKGSARVTNMESKMETIEKIKLLRSFLLIIAVILFIDLVFLLFNNFIIVKSDKSGLYIALSLFAARLFIRLFG